MRCTFSIRLLWNSFKPNIFDEFTRPDLAYSVSKLSRYSYNLGNDNWITLVRVLRYTMNYGLVYRAYPQVIEGFSDAN